MKLFKLFAITTLSLGMLSSVVFAHHSTNGIYHNDQNVELSGTIIAWRFINPHPYLTIAVEDENGDVHEWDVSFGGSAVTHLQRRGYTAETFTAGETIVVEGHPARAAGVYGLLVERSDPTRADGSPLF
jgi:hypothetical protein